MVFINEPPAKTGSSISGGGIISPLLFVTQSTMLKTKNKKICHENTKLRRHEISYFFRAFNFSCFRDYSFEKASQESTD